MIKLFSLLFIIVFAIVACTNSDDYIFDTTDSKLIEVEAFVTKSFDESGSRKKTDTIAPGDSLIFISSIRPSKTVRSQKVIWTLNGKILVHEFSFKTAIDSVGIHKAAFIFIDFFGDTLSDTVTIYCAAPPRLNSQQMIPANKSQNIPFNEPLSFSWGSPSSNKTQKIEYHFVLQDATDPSPNGLVIDTILEKPQFTLYKNLNPLAQYNWSVSAKNDLGVSSTESIFGNFFTSGTSNESAIFANLISFSNRIPDNLQFFVFNDSVLNKFDNVKIDSITGAFYLKPIPPGNYKLTAATIFPSDFIADTLKISLKENQVLQIAEFNMRDVRAPFIFSQESENDTLSSTGVFHFTLMDGGSEITLRQISAKLDGKSLTDIQFSGETLTVSVPDGVFWSYRILTIAVTDLSGNKRKKSFYLRPNAELKEVIQ